MGSGRGLVAREPGEAAEPRTAICQTSGALRWAQQLTGTALIPISKAPASGAAGTRQRGYACTASQEAANQSALIGSALCFSKEVIAMTETTAKALAVKLMAWKLPQDFSPDCFISFDRERATANGSWPVGTNLLTVAQAEQMFAYVLEGSPHAQAPKLLADLREAAALLRKYEGYHRAKGTEESDAKAEVNAAMAARFEATIAKATE